MKNELEDLSSVFFQPVLAVPAPNLLLINLSISRPIKPGSRQTRIKGHHSSGNGAVLNRVFAAGKKVGTSLAAILTNTPIQSHLFVKGLKVKADS